MSVMICTVPTCRSKPVVGEISELYDVSDCKSGSPVGTVY
jgi:hypothetical protein